MSDLQESNKQVVRRFNKEFIEDQNDAVFNEIVSPDFNDHSGDGHGGAQGAFFFFTQMFRPAFPDAKVVIHDLIAEGDKVVTHKSYQGTNRGDFMGMPASGKPVTIDVIEILRLADGKYVEHSAIMDTASLMQQLQGA